MDPIDGLSVQWVFVPFQRWNPVGPSTHVFFGERFLNASPIDREDPALDVFFLRKLEDSRLDATGGQASQYGIITCLRRQTSP